MSQQDSAQTLLNDCNEIFAHMISTMQRRCSEVEQLIKTREKTVVSQAEKHKEELEEELNRLRRRDAELQDLLNSDDLVYLMQVQTTHIVDWCRPDLVSSWTCWHGKWFVKWTWARSDNDATVFKMACHNWFSCDVVYVVLVHAMSTSGKPPLGHQRGLHSLWYPGWLLGYCVGQTGSDKVCEKVQTCDRFVKVKLILCFQLCMSVFLSTNKLWIYYFIYVWYSSLKQILQERCHLSVAGSH